MQIPHFFLYNCADRRQFNLLNVYRYICTTPEVIYRILLMLVFVSGGEVFTYDYIVYIIRFPVDEVMTTFLYGGKILLFL